MTSSAASRDRQREEPGRRCAGERAHHLDAAAAGQVHVEQHDVGPVLRDRGDRLVDVGGLGQHLDDADTGGLELGAHPAPEHRVVVDDDDPDQRHSWAAPRVWCSLGLGSDAAGAAAPRCPRPSVERTSAGAAVALHPVDDAVPHAVAVGRGLRRVEAAAAVAHEHVDPRPVISA